MLQETEKQKLSRMHHEHQFHHEELQKKLKARSVETKQTTDRTELEKRAASVEGRIESHQETYKTPLNVPIGPYQERVQSPECNYFASINVDGKKSASVKKAKSFREPGKQAIVARRENSRRSWFGKETQIDYSESSNSRLSASYDCLDDKTASYMKAETPSQSVVSLVSKEPEKVNPEKVLSPAMSSTLSSTDSLTTTGIPGVYIRPLSQYKKSPEDLKDEPQDSIHSFQENSFTTSIDSQSISNSGPLSLDSSISYIPLKEGDNIQKTMSSDPLMNTNITYVKPNHGYAYRDSAEYVSQSSASSNNHAYREPIQKSPQQPRGSSVTEIRCDSSKFPVSAPGPASVLRSMSLSTSDASGSYAILGRRASSADELEQKDCNDTSTTALTPLRPRFRKRESSLSTGTSHQQRESSEVGVPEFMRIQLNRVENPPQRVIYATEQDSSRDSLDVLEDESSRRRSSESQSAGSVDMEDNEGSFDRRHDMDKRRRESSLSTMSQSSQSSVAESGDEVMLRRPLRRERSLVMDQTSVKKKEEPELLKVFARRSFKVKECFTTSADNESDDQISQEGMSEISSSPLASQMSGVTKINPIYSTPSPPRTPVMSSVYNKKTSSPSLAKPASEINKDSPASTSPLPESSGEFECAYVETVSANVAVISNKQPSVRQPSLPRTSISAPSRSRNNSASPIGKADAATPSASSSEGSFNRINIRPMAVQKEATLFTNQVGNTFSSAILSRAQVDGDLNASSRVAPISDPSEDNQSPAMPDSFESAIAEPLTSVVWPPKNIKTNVYKSSPFPVQVKTDQVKNYSFSKDVEIVESPAPEVPTSTVEEVSEKPPAPEDDSLSQVQSVRRKFMTGPPKPINTASITPSPVTSCARSTSVPAGEPHPVIEARNTVPAFSVTVRSSPSRPSSYSASRSSSSASSSTGSANPSSAPHHRHSIGGLYVPHPRQQVSEPCSPSPPPTFRRSSSHIQTSDSSSAVKSAPQSAIIQSAMARQGAKQVDSSESSSSGEDWRALVRQRREDRLKQTKSVESVDQPIDVSRRFYIFYGKNFYVWNEL